MLTSGRILSSRSIGEVSTSTLAGPVRQSSLSGFRKRRDCPPGGKRQERKESGCKQYCESQGKDYFGFWHRDESGRCVFDCACDDTVSESEFDWVLG